MGKNLNRVFCSAKILKEQFCIVIKLLPFLLLLNVIQLMSKTYLIIKKIDVLIKFKHLTMYLE
jgi:hypothetical protein